MLVYWDLFEGLLKLPEVHVPFLHIKDLNSVFVLHRCDVLNKSVLVKEVLTLCRVLSNLLFPHKFINRLSNGLADQHDLGVSSLILLVLRFLILNHALDDLYLIFQDGFFSFQVTYFDLSRFESFFDLPVAVRTLGLYARKPKFVSVGREIRV